MYSKESVTNKVQSIQGHLHARRGRWKTHRLRAWQHRLTNVESDLPATCAARRRPVRGVVTKFGGDPETQRRPAHRGAWRNRPPTPCLAGTRGGRSHAFICSPTGAIVGGAGRCRAATRGPSPRHTKICPRLYGL